MIALGDHRSSIVALLSLLAPLVALDGCGGGSAPSGAGGGAGNSTGNGHLRATIDGQAWAADAQTLVVSAGASNPGALVITGTKVVSSANYLSLVFSLGFIRGPGSYPLGVNAGTNAGGTVSINDQSGGMLGLWMTDLTGSRGTLTVSSMSATRIAGTFAFIAPPQLGSTVTSTRTVTDGDFDLPVSSAFALRAADDYGSAVSATIDGQPWNGATVVGLGNTSSGALSFGGMTTGVSLSFITTTPVQSGGTYDQTAVRITASGSGASCCWGGGTGDLTSVAVTTLSSTRVAGTFAGLLQPGVGGGATAPLLIAGGTFDVRIAASQ
jgi:hypothetical protein